MSDLHTQYINYALNYIQLYPGDTNSESVAMRASELALKERDYEKVITVANYIPDTAAEKTRAYTNDLKGRAYLELENYQDAESVYCLLYTSPSPRDQRGSRMPSSA